MISAFLLLSFKPAFFAFLFHLEQETLRFLFSFLSLEWYHLNIFSGWYFSQASRQQLVILPAQHFTMYFEYKLNKQGDNIQPSHTPLLILIQSVVPFLVLTIASWPAYRFLRRHIRWSGIPVSFRIFHILWSTQRGDWSHSYRTVLPCLCLHLANYLVSFFTLN